MSVILYLHKFSDLPSVICQSFFLSKSVGRFSNILCFVLIQLTYSLIWNKRLVIKAENLRDVAEVGMLCNKCPLCVVHSVIEISNSNLNTPIVPVVDLHMPMNTYWAHMVSAL